MFFTKTKFTRQAIAVMLSGALIAGCTACSSDNNNTNNNTTNTNNNQTGQNTTSDDASSIDFGLADKIQDGAILHTWCWDFKTIEENLADIAAAGYSAIQTNAVQACVDPGGKAIAQGDGDKGMWYFQYQPTDFTIGNYNVGTRDELKSMCETAEKYGIKVIVDVVPNHTASSNLVAQALFDAAGGKDKLYHPHGFQTIKNYGNRLECTTYASGGLSDIDTENSGYQDYFIKFLNDCIDCGVDGFRYDSAKHIGLPDDPKANDSEENNFWTRVTSDEITNRENIFIYGEVLQGDNERITEYGKILDGVTASAYGGSIRSIANAYSPKIERLTNLNTDVPADHLVTWVESHDNYCNDTTYALLDNDEVAFGWAALTASGNGAPLFFSRPAGSEGLNWSGTINRIGFKGDDNYKNPIVVAANRFRNAMIGEELKVTSIDDQDKVMMIARGSKGVVILNGTKEEYSVSTSVSLADGTYTDRTGINGDFTVSGGTLTGKIATNGVAVLYNDGFIEIPDYATASISQEKVVIGDDYEITLHCENAASAQYSVINEDENGNFDEHNSEKIDFKDGDVIKVGTGVEAGSSIVIKLYVTNEAGITSTKAFRLLKKNPLKTGDEISFVKTNAWADTMYAYIYSYDENGEVKELSPWPGEAMTHADGFTYTYKLTQDLDEGYVVFNDGGDHKKPSKKDAEGFELEAGKKYN